MALSERLALIVSLDANGAIKSFNDLGKAADKNLSKTDDRLDRAGSKFQKAGAGMLAGAGLAAAGLYKAGQAAADLEQAVGGTEAVFKDAASSLDGLAQSAASSMGLSERAFREATTSLGGQLKGLGFSIEDALDKSVDLTKVAADLAATYGGTTAEAVQALGAAFRGEADPAERFNLFLNQNRVNAEAVALGLAKSTSSVDANAKAQATLSLITKQSADAQGQFARETGTAAGQMQIASAEFENAKAALGQSVAPVLADVAGRLADVAGGFSAANQASDGLVSKLATFGTLGLGVAGGMSFAVGKVISMRENLGKLIGPLKNAEGGLNKVGKATAGLGFAGAIIGAIQLGREMSDVTIDVDKFTEALKDSSSAGREKLKTLVALAYSEGKLDESVRDLAASDAVAAEQMINLAEAAGVPADAIDELRTILGEAKPPMDALAGSSGELSGDLGSAGRASETFGTGQDGLAAKIKYTNEKIQEQTTSIESLYEAVAAQVNADIAYRRAQDSTEDALAGVTAAQKEHGTRSEEYRRAVLEAEGALVSQAEAAVRLYEDTVTAAGGTLDAADKNAILKGSLEQMRDTLAPGSPLRRAIEEHITRLNAVPKTITTKLLADAGGAFRTVGEFLNYLNVSGFAGTASQASILLDFKQKQLLEGRASGGPVSQGTPYIVGENGPEVFMPNTAGSIIPNTRLVATGSGTTLEQTVNIYNPVAEEPSKSARHLRRVQLESAAY